MLVGETLLQRIESIKGIGLFHEADGRPCGLKEVALLYGDNGRGKSTLCSILRSAATADPSALSERKTIDGSNDPSVTLQFAHGRKVKFENGVWSEACKEILVFDTDFIDRNVYSGGEVTTNHRKNLLAFALGDKAVAARTALETATLDEAKAVDAQDAKKRELAGHHGDMALTVFQSLPRVQDIDEQISVAEKRLVSARSAGKLLQRSAPSQLKPVEFPVESWFSLLAKSLDDLHEDAEAAIDQHLERLPVGGAEPWLAEGRQYDDGMNCPYCGQATYELDIISAYRTHFNAAYTALKGQLELVEKNADEATSVNAIQKIISDVESANKLIGSWSDVVELSEIELSPESIAVAVENVRVPLLRLLAMKRAAVAEAVGSNEDRDEIKRTADYIRDLVRSQNDTLAAHEVVIAKFKGALAAEDVAQISLGLKELQLRKVRHGSVVIQLLGELKVIDDDLKTAEIAKRDARSQLTKVMQETLVQYRNDINKNLRSLGATFEIEEFQTNFRGLEPRTDYGISLRGKTVKLTGGSPSFSTALSEGDKRTLAFAFFVAMALSAPDVADKIVVVDDPVSSLDRSRRNNTQKILTQISDKCAQIIVLGHDANFIRDLRNTYEKHLKIANTISVHQLSRSHNKYSSFSAVDIDKECESPYHRNYRLVHDFVSGGQGNVRDSAIAIRPLLEGYLHRRFPGGLLPARSTLGAVLVYIGQKSAPSPLAHIHPLLDELNEINGYASRFHHDTASDCDAEVANDIEVESYGTRALNVIYGAPV